MLLQYCEHLFWIIGLIGMILYKAGLSINKRAFVVNKFYTWYSLAPVIVQYKTGKR